MITSRSTHETFLAEILDDNEVIPPGKRAYFQERFRDRLYELVVSQFFEKEDAGLLKRADLARRIGRKPEQITRWLGAPGNWTIETVSDLLLAICKAEPIIGLRSLENLPIRNFSHPQWFSFETPRKLDKESPRFIPLDDRRPQSPKKYERLKINSSKSNEEERVVETAV